MGNFDLKKITRPDVWDEKLKRPDWTHGQRRNPDLLWLDKNENTDPKLAAFTEKILKEVASEYLYTYPECAPLYLKLAQYLDVPASHLLLTAGSDGAIRSVFEAFISPGDVVVHTVPTFAMYPVYSRMYGARVVPLEYQATPEGPSLTSESIIDAVRKHRPKLLCLPNPDSPTGSVLAPEALRKLLTVCSEVGTLLLVDEAYHPFYEPTVVPWTAEFENLIVARTFAKAWGLAGLRIGYAVASPPIATILHKVRPMYEVNTLAVGMMERMIEHRQQMEASVKRLEEGKALFLDEMDRLGLSTLKGYGNFLHVSFGQYSQRVHSELSHLVLYRRDFAEPCLAGFSRFSATSKELFLPVIEKIKFAIRAESKQHG